MTYVADVDATSRLLEPVAAGLHLGAIMMYLESQ